MIPAFPVIDFPSLPGTAPAAQPASQPAQLDGPLATRFPWRLTIAGKAEYYDAAATNYLPQSLSEAIVLLYICAHPTEHMWQARAPEHEDGVDSVLPLGMDPVGLRKSIALWAARSLRHDEDAELMALALQLWVDGHATFATPTDGSAQKKTDRLPTGLSPMSTSSPTETQPDETTSSIDCPCAMPTQQCMPDSTQPASIA
jgi:hypothetical protein